jgi:protein-L-isoaspartate(D-aspartate) O-methyltransferase
MIDYATARHNMVESQIRTNKVTDEAIISAFETVPREQFVPKGLQGIAYVDEDLHLGGGRHLMEPMVLARLLQIATPGPDDVALDIGCATGYSTAILSKLVGTVVGLDDDAGLVDSGNKCLSDLQIDNTALIAGPTEQGYAKQAPYDLIVFAGSVEVVPDAILAQLADHGRLLAVVRSADGEPGRATIYQRSGTQTGHRVVFDANVPALPGFRRAQEFVF